jgi:hypothetical protein
MCYIKKPNRDKIRKSTLAKGGLQAATCIQMD